MTYNSDEALHMIPYLKLDFFFVGYHYASCLLPCFVFILLIHYLQQINDPFHDANFRLAETNDRSTVDIIKVRVRILNY